MASKATQNRTRISQCKPPPSSPPSRAPRATRTPAPTPTHTPRHTPAATATPTNTPLPLLLLNNLLPLRRPLLLSSPVTTLFIVFADPQRTSQFLALLNLRLRQLVHLVALQSPRAGPASIARLLGFEFLAQSGALVVDVIFVNTVRRKKRYQPSSPSRQKVASTAGRSKTHPSSSNLSLNSKTFTSISLLRSCSMIPWSGWRWRCLRSSTARGAGYGAALSRGLRCALLRCT